MRLKQFFAALLLLVTASAQAQQMPPIPVDKDVRIGKLDNGLTYYLRHNDYPEHVASFYIAQKVGSINENDDQRGLAHLLEHMAFNGSEHFKDNAMQEYLQSIGVEYGRNLNAFTAMDKTVYYITDVPTKRISALDSCLLVLKDWSNGLTLDAKAIDEERDIVHNEYRMRIIGAQKILEKVLPQLYPGSKYGERFPIGLMSIIDGCSPETLRAYYRKWYRPDNQGIIIVGDIDVARTEEKIKTLFGSTKVPADAAKVIPEPVPDNAAAIYVIGKDKEMQADIFQVFMKHDATPDAEKNDMGYLIEDFAKDIITRMLNARLDERAQNTDCSFLQGRVEEGEYLFSRTKDALSVLVVPKEGKDIEGLKEVLRELKRAHDFGFTATEFERAKADYMSGLEKKYNNRAKTPSNEYCEEYVDNFIENEPIPSIEDRYQILNQVAPMLTVDVLNGMKSQLFCENDTNLVVLAMLQEKDGKQYVTADQLKQAVDSVRTEQLTAYVDNVKQEPLMAQMPKKGKIVKETTDTKLGFKRLTLSNGATVMMKKTDHNADEILMNATSQGGSSVFGKADINNLQVADYLLGQSGLGNFNNTELQKALAGKQCSTAFSIKNATHSLSGKTTPKDLETMMQLVYLDFTAVKKDEKAAKSTLDMFALSMKNAGLNPDLVYMDSVNSTLYRGNKLFCLPTESDIKAVNYDRVLQIGKLLYGNAANFTFTFVGNFDEAKLRGFIEQYIASLPSSKNMLKAKEMRTFANGTVKNEFTKKMENPQAQANEIWRSGAVPYTLDNVVKLDVAARLLDMTFNRTIREQLSAAYHAGAESECDDDGLQTFLIIKGIGKLNPDKASKAIPYFMKGLKETVSQPNADDLNKVKQILLKQADVDNKTNSYWISVLGTLAKHGVDVNSDYKKTIEAVTPASISAFLKDVILKSNNCVEVIMMPAK